MVKLQEKYGLFINGEFVPASGGKTLDTFDPVTGKKLAAIVFIMIVLSCKDISKSYGVNSIFENISFNVEDKDKIGL